MNENSTLPAKKKMGRPEYWTEKRIAELEASLWKHANDPESHDILGWRRKEKLTRGMVFGICKKAPDFRDAYEIAKAKIGSRRQLMELTGKWSPSIVRRNDWSYDKELEAHNKEMRSKNASKEIAEDWVSDD